MRTKKFNKGLHILVTAEQKKELKQFAKEQKKSIGEVVREILFLNKNGRQSVKR